MGTKVTNRRFGAGEDWERLRAEMERRRESDRRWDDPRNLKASYFAGDDVVSVASEAYRLFQGDNLIYGQSLYPSLPELEREVIAMLCDLLNAPDEATGSVTTGGTESIFLAVKTARDHARAAGRGGDRPEIIVPRTAHPAFDKAAHLLGMRIVRMAHSTDWRADVAAMRDTLDERSVMLVGSAPPYPYANVDPISDIAAIAREHGLWMHVDACVGGFVLPFARALGNPVPEFDLGVPGVHSLSVDLHKYGYAARGSSALLLRERSLAEHQRFSSGEWPAGTYSTMGFAGSRPGGPLASAWAVMRYLGFEGYTERVRRILEARSRIAEGLAGIEGLEILGRPEGGHFCIVAERNSDLDALAVADAMEERGWMAGRLRDPPGMIVLLNFRHVDVADDLLADLERAAADVRAGKVRRGTGDAVYVT